MKDIKIIKESKRPHATRRKITAAFKLTKEDIAEAMKQDFLLVEGVHYIVPHGQLANTKGNDVYNLTLTEASADDLKKAKINPHKKNKVKEEPKKKAK